MTLTARRRLLAAGAATLAMPWVTHLGAQSLPAMTLGPFYPLQLPPDSDSDLTQVAGRPAPAQGERLDWRSQLVDAQGRPLGAARVEIWQCDALGAYHHSRDRTEPRDPNFQGFGAAETDAEGRFAFRTIRPVPYSGRTPHIHVKVQHPAVGEFVTQMFVRNDPGNAGDFLFRRLDAQGREAVSMVLNRQGDGWTSDWPLRLAVRLPS